MELDSLKSELIRDEDLKLKPYTDTKGKVTIGIGRNLDDVGLSTEEAHYLCENDIGRVLSDLDRNMPWWRNLSENRQRALANMVFNLGWPRFAGFQKMIAALGDDDYERAAAEALDSKWAGQVGPRADRIAAMIREG